MIEKYLNKEKKIVLVFFSPSCVKNSIRVIEEALKNEKIQYIAIGKTTNQALDSCDKNIMICTEPTSKGVMDEIKKIR